MRMKTQMLRSPETGDLTGKIRLQIYDRTAKAIQNGNADTQLNRKKSDGYLGIFQSTNLGYTAVQLKEKVSYRTY